MHLLGRNPSWPRDSHWIALEILAPGPGLSWSSIFFPGGRDICKAISTTESDYVRVPLGGGGGGCLAMTGALSKNCFREGRGFEM